MLINKTSLSQTVDAINAALFDGRTLATAERGRAARWITGRQGLPGAYGDTFAGFPSERSRGIVLFTGEHIASASARHILGEEASRALRQLRVRDRSVTRALDGADRGLMRCLEARRRETRASAIPVSSLLRQVQRGLVAQPARGRLDRREERLRRGASHLGSTRDGEHRWRKFPFWYTVLALSEMDSVEARTELTHAAPVLERTASRAVPSAVYARRRHDLAVRTLNRL